MYYLQEQQNTHTHTHRASTPRTVAPHACTLIHMSVLGCRKSQSSCIRCRMFCPRLSLILLYFFSSSFSTFVRSFVVLLMLYGWPGQFAILFGQIFRNVFSPIRSTRSIHASNTCTQLHSHRTPKTEDQAHTRAPRAAHTEKQNYNVNKGAAVGLAVGMQYVHKCRKNISTNVHRTRQFYHFLPTSSFPLLVSVSCCHSRCINI